ncbi:MAG: glutamate racemase [Methylobacillus sp.]|jgi:glutamate racemase|nr:glutamate racemase [Methylobacillus sp.]
MNSSPIGVFDSGVGGLSVLHHIRTELPCEHLLYIADSAHAPYGGKSTEEICARASALSEFLIAHDAKALVVACNTATAAAIAMLRERYAIPVIGMEPAVKPAVTATKSGVVGVLATTGTLQSARFAALLENYGQNVRVVTQGCPGLVECVERGELATTATRNLLNGYLQPLLEQGADTLVLGCTHYPFLKPLIRELAGENIALIDTGAAVAQQVRRRVAEAGLLSPATMPGSVRFWTSGDAVLGREVVGKLWGEAAVEKM